MFNRVVNGFDVFEVGKEQLWSWCGWGFGGRQFGSCPMPIECHTDSLALGKYLVVELDYCIQDARDCFQDTSDSILESIDQFSKPKIWGAERSLKAALSYACSLVIRPGARGRFNYCYGNLIEIWHVAKDEELWMSWIYDSALSLEVSDEDFDELADDAFPFGDCWESCIDACTPACDGDTEKAEIKSETILDKAKRLEEEAQDNYDLYGAITQGPTDMLHYLGIYCGDYDELTDDARDAIGDFWDKLTVWDNRYGHACWNTLIDEEMTAKLAEHYSERIWHDDGTLRLS